MKRFNIFNSENLSQDNNIAFKGGTYSIAITAIVLAILLTVNVLVAALPKSTTNLDISSSKLYSITSNTKVVASSLSQDVTIHWIVQAGMEDAVIENLLSNYDELSEHITVEVKNPDIYPTFAEQYTEEQVLNNSLVVKSGERSRYISYDDIYLQEADMYSYSYNTSFDGEGAITSAIDYVVSEELPKLYVLEGHGEETLPTSFAEQIEKDNIEMIPLSLLTVDEIPEDASAIIIYSPSSDISEDERDMLTDYAANGGKLLVMAGPVEGDALVNLNSVLTNYGITVGEGVIVEEDRQSYALQTPHMLIPTMAEHALTTPLVEENYYPLMPISQPLTITGTTSATVTELLTTSETAFSKTAGLALDTFEKEEGDVDGPFAVALDIQDGSGGRIIWFGSSAFLYNEYNAYSSGANVDLAMNAVSSLIGESEAMAIRTKSLNYNYLTISDSTSSLLQVLMIGVFPLAYIAIGLFMVFSRRRVKNDAQ